MHQSHYARLITYYNYYTNNRVNMYTLIKAIATPEVPHTQLAFLQLFAQESQYKGICAHMCGVLSCRRGLKRPHIAKIV